MFTLSMFLVPIADTVHPESILVQLSASAKAIAPRSAHSSSPSLPSPSRWSSRSIPAPPRNLATWLLASASALTALLVAAWVAVTLVPVAGQTHAASLDRLSHGVPRHRRAGSTSSAIVLVALAALNTGNNLLFLILASLIAIILMSGILSSITLPASKCACSCPNTFSPAQPVRASLELKNEKLTLPSFSLRVEGVAKKDSPAPAVLETPVYFPYLPRQEAVSQTVPMLFPKRGVYRQEAFRIVTRFPFGFLQKARRLDLAAEALVYPSVEASAEFLEVLPGIQGAMEASPKAAARICTRCAITSRTIARAIVHWKATARSGSLMVREFAREDDCSVLLVFDPTVLPLFPILPRAKKTASSARLPFAPRLPGVSTNAAFCSNFAVLEPRRLSLLPPKTSSSFFAISPAFNLSPDPQATLLSDLAADSESFKIIVTAQPRGSVPASIWNSSYVVFSQDQV